MVCRRDSTGERPGGGLTDDTAAFLSTHQLLNGPQVATNRISPKRPIPQQTILGTVRIRENGSGRAGWSCFMVIVPPLVIAPVLPHSTLETFRRGRAMRASSRVLWGSRFSTAIDTDNYGHNSYLTACVGCVDCRDKRRETSIPMLSRMNVSFCIITVSAIEEPHGRRKLQFLSSWCALLSVGSDLVFGEAAAPAERYYLLIRVARRATLTDPADRRMRAASVTGCDT